MQSADFDAGRLPQNIPYLLSARWPVKKRGQPWLRLILAIISCLTA